MDTIDATTVSKFLRVDPRKPFFPQEILYASIEGLLGHSKHSNVPQSNVHVCLRARMHELAHDV